MPKFFVNNSDISGDKIYLDGENMHHLVNVLRCKINEEVTVSDSSGFDYTCIIDSISKENVILKITDKMKSAAEPLVKISLFQGLPKGDKLSLIVEKCVEAGVYEITPVNMSRCVSRLTPKDFSKKKERFEKISMSAAKQSGRGIVPSVNDLITLKEFLERAKDYDLVVFPYEEAKGYTLKDAVKGFVGEKIAVIIGPEGGFSEDEVKLIESYKIKPVTLGSRILRTETAGLSVVFNILYELEL